MPLAAPSSRRRRVIHLLWLGVALADIFVLALATVLVMQGRASEEQEARGLTANYSRILEESLRGVFGKIDLVLQTVQDEAEREIARGGIQEEEMNRFLARQDARLPEALGLRVTDAQGIIRYGVKDIRVAHASIADRPQFLRMKNDPRAGLVISRPVMGRAAQKWMITLSRRLNDPQGRFAGDVHVAVGIDYFLAMFSQVDLGEKGNIGLWERDALIARYTKADARGASAGSTTPSPELYRLLHSGQEEAFYHTRSGVDGIDRSFHFRHIRGFPLYFVVGLAESDYLAQWRQSSRDTLLTALLFVVASWAVAGFISRSWRRQEADQEALHRQERDYSAKLQQAVAEARHAQQLSESILTSAGEGICGVDREGRVMFVNPAARRMFGWQAEEGLGWQLHPTTHHHHPDGQAYAPEDCPIHQTLADGLSRQIKDDVYWRKDGRAFPVEYNVAAICQEGRITGAVNVFRDITERKELEERITHLALFDTLTGLPNRASLAEAIPRLAAAMAQQQARTGLLYVDLDGFKGINDTLGHNAGDRVLQETAQRMKSCLRADDLIVRLGGDEFLVLSPGGAPTREGLEQQAQRLMERIHQPIPLTGKNVCIGASIGMALYPEDDPDLEHCIQRADDAMYQAKRAGKGCYRWVSPLPEGKNLART